MIHYANLSVPRYTSYPTAPHFNNEVGPDDVARWLAEIPADQPISLYLHVPYCREICLYCGCHTKATRQDGPLFQYAEGLLSELKLVAAAIGRRQPVSHVHWGGGTPSLLPRFAFEEIVAGIDGLFGFAPNAEHAIELDPRSVTAELVETLAHCGVNRASLGVQDFDLGVQKAIGRVQPRHQVHAAVKALRDGGIEAINFDLMYGLPHQTVETIIATVDASAEMKPDRIALFGYAHVPWFKKHQRLIDEASLPDSRKRMALESAARGALAAWGYRPIGLDHFAKAHDALAQASDKHELHRNFQGYTIDAADTLIGVGASSIGRLRQGFAQNAPDIGGWRAAVDRGELPIVKGKAFTADDLLRADIIEQLMCYYSVDLEAVCRTHAVSIDTLVEARSMLMDLAGDGLVTFEGPVVKVAPDAKPFVRVVASAFDAYLPKQAARHSTAV